MVKVESQPMEGREGSGTWEMVVRREERGQSGGARGKENQITGGRAHRKRVLGCCGLEGELSTSDREGKRG